MSELPDKWVVTSLQHLCTIVYGKNLPKSAFTENGYPVFGANGIIGCYTRYLYHEEQVLISCRGAYSGTINISPPQAFITNNSLVLETPGESFIHKRYIFFCLQSVDKAKLVTGSAQPQVTINNANVLPLPLPPLNEQKRIVAKIEELFSELDAGEESLRQARRQLGVYRQSLLKQAFEGKLTQSWRTQNPDLLESPDHLLARIQSERQSRYQQKLKDWEASEAKGGKPKEPSKLEQFDHSELIGNPTLPEGWIIVPYGELCSIVRNGISKKPTGDSGYKIARISAVRPMAFNYEDYRYLDCDENFAAAYTLLEDDLIFTRYNGARRFVGVCARFKGKEQRLYPDKLIRTRPDLPSINPSFLEISQNSGLSRTWMETKIRTTAGQSGISGGDVKAMPAPLCSLAEQQEIVRLLDAQFEIIEQNEREIDDALRRSETLRQSILKKAFTGNLVPQDPTDEPASQLLARIQAQRDAAIPKKRAAKKIARSTSSRQAKKRSPKPKTTTQSELSL